MKKEEKEKQLILLELEKIKIQHENELAYINRKTWLKITIIFGLLFSVFTSLWQRIPDEYLGASVFGVVLYVLLLLTVSDYALKYDFYGKPIKFFDKILYFVFLDFIFRKGKGIIKKYEDEINKLKKSIK